jgi:rare lipoprotein A
MIRTQVARGAFLATLCVAAALPLTGPAEARVQCGKASWYALTSRTASGEPMNPSGLSAAHRTLPFGTKVRVENLRNGRSVVVRINDRGPFIRNRVIDLSKGAAKQLGFISAGLANVRVSVLDGSERRSSPDSCG